MVSNEKREVITAVTLFVTALFLIGFVIGWCTTAQAGEDMRGYATEVALSYDLSPELVQAVIEVESSWNPNCKTGKCVGLMQLNIDTAPWIARELGISGDRSNWRQNIQMGCYYLDYLRSYWYDKGATDEDALYLMLLSYNRGVGGATKWAKSHDIESDGYCNKVLSIKYRLEGWQ